MCLTKPVKVLKIKDQVAHVKNASGEERDVSIVLLDKAQAGDWILINAGMAVEIIDEKQARELIELTRIEL